MKILISFLLLLVTFGCNPKNSKEPLRVGILHSLSGTMMESEKPVVAATLFAIDEINQKGGVLGRQIQPIIFDGKSDWDTFAEGAQKLIEQDQVRAIFGCWTSASRKKVKPIVEQHNNLLFYPVQYEGNEQSRNIVYTGSAPNQQIIPGATWAFFNLGTRIFLVGSDYIFPRIANITIKKVIAGLGGEIMGEEYIPLGSTQVSDVIEKIVAKKPDVILNTINGDTNDHFFKALREEQKITPEQMPTLSFSMVESQFNRTSNSLVGDYAVWSYFQSLDTSTNDRFIKQFHQFTNSEQDISDPMEAAYNGVHLWAKAVILANSTATDQVRAQLNDLVFDAPQGIIYIDGPTQHTWKFLRIGKLRHGNKYEIIWDSGQPIRPIPFPFGDKDE